MPPMPRRPTPRGGNVCRASSKLGRLNINYIFIFIFFSYT